MTIEVQSGEHSGEESISFSAPLDPPMERAERSILWRYTSVQIRFTRRWALGEWRPWHVDVRGDAHNVLKSGQPGNRTIGRYDGRLGWTGRREGDFDLDDWCEVRVRPILDEAIRLRDESCWKAVA